MKTAADHVEAAVGDETGRGATGELHQEKEREGAEGPEQCHLGVRERRVSDGEDRRHDDRSPDRALDNQEIRVLGADPAHDAHRRWGGR